MPDQEERQKHTGLISKTSNAYGTGRTVFGLGRTAVTAISAAGPEVWIVVGTIVGLFILTLLVVFATAAIPISQTPPAPTPTPTTAPPPPTP